MCTPTAQAGCAGGARPSHHNSFGPHLFLFCQTMTLGEPNACDRTPKRHRRPKSTSQTAWESDEPGPPRWSAGATPPTSFLDGVKTLPHNTTQGIKPTRPQTPAARGYTHPRTAGAAWGEQNAHHNQKNQTHQAPRSLVRGAIDTPSPHCRVKESLRTPRHRDSDTPGPVPWWFAPAGQINVTRNIPRAPGHKDPDTPGPVSRRFVVIGQKTLA